MAPGSSSCAGIVCKRCNKNVINALKCENCSNLFHLSCAKLTNNVKFVNDNKIICCDNTDNPSVTNDNEVMFFDASEVLPNMDNKVDIKIFNYIIKQKDIIIQELRDKISLLNNHIDIITKYYSNCNKKEEEQKPNLNNQINDISEAKRGSNKIDNKNSVKKNEGKTNKQNSSEVNKHSNLITNESLATGLRQVESQLKLQEYINLPNSAHSSHAPQSLPLQKKDDEWKNVIRKKHKRSVVVGNNTDCTSIKGVPKTVDLHVYRIDTETTPALLTNFLKPNFPEVICQAIQPKYPELYTSYKVTVMEDNFKKAMDPQFWPKGACIQRFLVIRNVKEGTRA